MKLRNAEIHRKIRANTPIFQVARRSDVVMQIRSRMLEKGLKNIDVAERLGVSEANISRWLRGNQNLSLDTMYILADAIEEPLVVSVGRQATAGDQERGRCFEADPSKAESEAGATDLAPSASERSDFAGTNIINMAAYAALRDRAQSSRGPDFAVARSEYGIVDFDERLVN